MKVLPRIYDALFNLVCLIAFLAIETGWIWLLYKLVKLTFA